MGCSLYGVFTLWGVFLRGVFFFFFKGCFFKKKKVFF